MSHFDFSESYVFIQSVDKENVACELHNLVFQRPPSGQSNTSQNLQYMNKFDYNILDMSTITYFVALPSLHPSFNIFITENVLTLIVLCSYLHTQGFYLLIRGTFTMEKNVAYELHNPLPQDPLPVRAQTLSPTYD